MLSVQSAAQQMLARGEDHHAYRLLEDAITADLMPRNSIEAGFTRSIINDLWDAERYRMIEAYLWKDLSQKNDVSAQSARAVTGLLYARPDGNIDPTEHTSVKDTSSSNQAQGTGGRQQGSPSKAGHTDHRAALLASFQKYRAPLELAARLRSRAEARRDATIRDLERYRASAQRRQIDVVEDAEFTEVRHNGIKSTARGQSPKRAEEHRSSQLSRTRQSKQKRA
jgi:hypothetical protein